MASIELFLPLAHLLGLALAIGCSTAKLTLLLKCKADQTFLPAYFATVKTITRFIAVGTILLTLSGVTWLLLGYPLTDVLIVKLVMVGVIFVLGATIDKVVEPRFRKLAPASGESASPEFIRIQRLYLLVEVSATGLYYAIVVMWLLA